jgi:hypothetical protein
MSRSMKSALAIAAVVVMLGAGTGQAVALGGPVQLNGGATGCCRTAV